MILYINTRQFFIRTVIRQKKLTYAYINEKEPPQTQHAEEKEPTHRFQRGRPRVQNSQRRQHLSPWHVGQSQKAHREARVFRVQPLDVRGAVYRASIPSNLRLPDSSWSAMGAGVRHGGIGRAAGRGPHTAVSTGKSGSAVPSSFGIRHLSFGVHANVSTSAQKID